MSIKNCVAVALAKNAFDDNQMRQVKAFEIVHLQLHIDMCVYMHMYACINSGKYVCACIITNCVDQIRLIAE